MGRKILDAEVAYHRVREFIVTIPPEILATLRVEFTKPKVIDSLLIKIKKGIGFTSIEHVDQGWCFCFIYGELEFREFLRQIL